MTTRIEHIEEVVKLISEEDWVMIFPSDGVAMIDSIEFLKTIHPEVTQETLPNFFKGYMMEDIRVKSKGAYMTLMKKDANFDSGANFSRIPEFRDGKSKPKIIGCWLRKGVDNSGVYYDTYNYLTVKDDETLAENIRLCILEAIIPGAYIDPSKTGR